MQIAALLQVHKRPDLTAELVGRLSTRLWKVYVHVDRKTDIKPFLKLSEQGVFAKKRTKVFWAGFGQIEATLLLLRQSYHDTKNTHFYVMSGQCFPIKTDEEIREFLEQPGCAGNFMSTEKMPVTHKPLSRLTQRHCNNIRSSLLRRIVNKMLQQLPERNVDSLLRGMEPWAGSTWWMLNRKAVGEIVDFLSKNRWYLHAFRYTLCADECFFHTLVHHLAITLDGPSPTIAKWIEGNVHPEIITPSDLDGLTREWQFRRPKIR